MSNEPPPADPGRVDVAEDLPGFDTPRRRLARALFTLSIFALPAFAIATPLGLKPSVYLALIAVLLAPDCVLAGWRQARGTVWTMLGLVVFVIGVVVVSQLLFDVGWSEVDNRARLVMLPVVALTTCAFRPPRSALWGGAVVGLAGACAIACVQYFGGAERAQGWTNPIVFADVAIVLVAIALFLRPSGRLLWSTLAAVLGVLAIGLSGSRGVWLALVVVAVVAGLAAWRRMRPWDVLAVLVLGMGVAWVLMPQAQTRVDALRRDIDRYAHGDVDSSAGARLELLGMAWGAMREQPLTGVGLASFGKVVRAAPDCAPERLQVDAQLCRLGHAHSDVAEWAATMGVPGLLAVIALYAVPLGLFARVLLQRPFPRRTRSVAMTGTVVVLAFFTCGLTQSMFAHQLTASSYALLVGVLLGYLRLEDPAKG